MRTLKIYSGHIRTFEQNKVNHRECLGHGDEVHYNDIGRDLDFYNGIEWEQYRANKVGETTPNSSINQWHNMWNAFCLAPKGYHVYIRMRYDIRLTGVVDLNVDLSDNKIYIPTGHDYHEGYNDQMAFGSYTAIRKYYSVYLYHTALFSEGKRFHTEGYLKFTLEKQGVEIIRIPQETQIIR
jgi:hypothetical protein